MSYDSDAFTKDNTIQYNIIIKIENKLREIPFALVMRVKNLVDVL